MVPSRSSRHLLRSFPGNPAELGADNPLISTVEIHRVGSFDLPELVTKSEDGGGLRDLIRDAGQAAVALGVMGRGDPVLCLRSGDPKDHLYDQRN